MERVTYFQDREAGCAVSAAPKDAYQVVTDRIVMLLEAGTVPWRQPWRGAAGVALSLDSGKPYRGINAMLLSTLAFPSPYWVTFNGARKRGGSVKAGSKGAPIVFWTFLQKGEDDSKRTIPMLRLYTVFNASQCDGLEVPAPPDLGPAPDPVPAAQAILDAFVSRPGSPKLDFVSDKACYWPASDTVSLPDLGTFESAAAFYSIAFHECVHATGHPSRLARRVDGEVRAFGSADYSREELIAEMGACFLSSECALLPDTEAMSAAYCASWVRALKADTRAVVVAAGAASKAAHYILSGGPLSG